MLEVKNLVKVYKTKGGADVRAIDDVSITFAEKGMIFLLGKSGSGKSTLLNLCGGLDSPDSGEIIIKGRSSKDFTKADFDSYRNTFVGFVFQEYNILDEFSVENNIALALELQGRNKDKQAVSEILEKVDLAAFAKRKPNTLSGGQKQRVAIARALVKNPEIILADEPTGALDSNTGKQVLDTLKKLSEEKLVIIVSHDREFAEQYGDRIIELKDGKIISDVTKTKIAATQASENVSIIGEDTLSVKKGSALTEEDMSKIKDFLTSKGGNVVIASGEKELSAYKKMAKIDDNGAKESFKDTEKSDISGKEYTAEDGKLIRSRLPLKHAVKIGASSLKVKPFRLFFTILLSLIAFTMFGLFSTLTFYNANSTAVATYKNSGYDYMYMTKKYNYTTKYYSYGKDNGSYESSYSTRFTPEDLSDAKEKYGNVYGAYNFTAEKHPTDMSLQISNTKSLNSSYYSTAIKMFVEVPGDTTDFELLTDTDLSTLGNSDVVISSYLFDSIKNAGLYNNYTAAGGYATLNDYSDIVGKVLALNTNYSTNITPVTVRGVYRADPPEKYASIKDGTEAPDSSLSTTYMQLLKSGMFSMALVSPAFYDAHSTLLNSSNYIDYSVYYLKDSMELRYSGLSDMFPYNFSSIAPFSVFPVNREKVYFFEEGKNSLSENEILLPFGAVKIYMRTFLNNYSDKLREDSFNAEYEKEILKYKEKYADEIAEYRKQQYAQYISQGYSQELAEEYTETDVKYFTDSMATSDDPEFFNKLYQISNDVVQEFNNKVENSLNIIENCQYYKDGLYFAATSEDIAKAFEFLLQYVDPSDIADFSIELYESSGSPVRNASFTCAGFTYGVSNGSSMVYFEGLAYKTLFAEYGNTNSGNDPNGEFYSEEVSKYTEPADAKFNYFVLPFPEEATLNALVNNQNTLSDNDSFFTLATPLSEQLLFVNTLIDGMEKIFLWVGIAMALFSMLLLFNFISVSIANKKKEIGILRAVGARSADVFKIFYAESAIITMICYVLAMIACLVICPILNTQIAATLSVSIFVFGPVSWLIMLAIALVTSIIATFLPVYSIARKKPVESIRAL